jgi:hypothetical protein
MPLTLRAGTQGEWSTMNPKLALSEVGLESDSHLFRVGTGTARWNELAAAATVPGYVFRFGVGSPSDALGSDGDYYFDETARYKAAFLYGPKASGHWPAGMSVVGPQGDPTSSSAGQLPIGFVFISKVSTNPATLLGYGTWTATGVGEVLVGYKSGDADFGTPGGTGGAKVHTHAGHSNHVVTQPVNHSDHVVTQPDAHSNHTFTQPSAHSNHLVGQANNHVPTSTMLKPGSLVAVSVVVAIDAHAGATVDAHSAHTGGAVDAHSAHSGAGVDSHSAHSGAAVDAHSAHDSPKHLMDYLTVYMFERTA